MASQVRPRLADTAGTNLFLNGGCQHEGIQGAAQVLLLLIDDAQPLIAVREVWRQPDDLLEAGYGLVKPAAIVAFLTSTDVREELSVNADMASSDLQPASYLH